MTGRGRESAHMTLEGIETVRSSETRVVDLICPTYVSTSWMTDETSRIAGIAFDE